LFRRGIHRILHGERFKIFWAIGLKRFAVDEVVYKMALGKVAAITGNYGNFIFFHRRNIFFLIAYCKMIMLKLIFSTLKAIRKGGELLSKTLSIPITALPGEPKDSINTSIWNSY